MDKYIDKLHREINAFLKLNSYDSVCKCVVSLTFLNIQHTLKTNMSGYISMILVLGVTHYCKSTALFDKVDLHHRTIPLIQQISFFINVSGANFINDKVV